MQNANVLRHDVQNLNFWSDDSQNQIFGVVRSGVPCLLPVNHVT